MSIEVNQVNTLKDLLKRKKTNQNKLAQKMGVDRSVLSRWADGSQLPTFKLACLMASKLGVSLKELAEALGIDVSEIPDKSETEETN